MSDDTRPARVAIVTGAAAGIGAATAIALAAFCTGIVLVDMQDSAATAAAVGHRGAVALPIAADVSQRPLVQAAVAQTLGRFGQVDILANIAGFGSFATFETIGDAEWDRMMDVNLKGTFLFCQAVLAPMRARRYGRIINTGSLIAKNGGNTRPWMEPDAQARTASAAYAASKAGVHALTVSLAKQVAADGITVNAVAPGPIETGALRGRYPAAAQRQIPVGRIGQPEDVADAIAFLASDRTGFITGEILDVNGGLWMD